jgi:hypothetical protein
MNDTDNLLQKVAMLPAAKRQRLLGRLQKQLAKAASPETMLCRADPDRPALLSYAQERLWFIDQLAPGSSIYNIPLVRRLRGRVYDL